MLDFRFLFRWIALFGCLLFSQGALLAQESVDTVYTMADTVVARQMLEEVKNLIGKRKLDEALEKVMMAERIYRQTLGEESREMGDVWHQMGIVWYYLGDLDKAIEYCQKTLKVRLKVLELKHSDVSRTYNNLGSFFYSKGEFSNSIEYHQKALESRLEALGMEHPDVASSYNNLGNSFHAIGEYENAIEHHQKALEIRLKTLGTEHLDVATSYNNMGNWFDERGEYDKAIEYHQKALEIRLKTLGTEHPDVATSYNNMGNSLLFGKGEYDKARKYHLKSLEIRLKSFGTNHPEVAASYNNLGITFDAKGEYNKAIEYHQKALEIRLKSIETEIFYAASSYTNLGASLYNLGEFEKATNCYQKALEILVNFLGTDHPEVAVIYNNLGLSFGQSKEFEKANDYHQKALEIRLKSLGSEHPSVAYSLSNLGALLHNRNKFDSALEYHQQALEVWLKTLRPGHPHLAHSYNNLGESFASKLSYEKANEYFIKALELSHYTVGDYSKIESFDELLRALSALSYILQTQYHQTPTPGLLTQSHDYALQAIAAIDYQQSSFSEESAKTFWQGKNYPVYEQAIGVSLLKADVDKDAALRHNAFTYAEKSKAGQLQAQFQSANAAKVAGVPDSLLQQEHDLRIDIAWREKQRQGLLDKGLAETDTSVLRIGGIVFNLKQQAASLVELLKENYPDYHDLKYNLSTITVEEVQRELLRPQEALLEYFVGDSSIFIFVIKQDDYQVVEVKKDFPLEAWVDTLRNNIYKNKNTGARGYAQAAADLYDKLVRPVEHLLPERLIIIPDGVLGYVPFDALLTERPKDPNKYARHKYLLEKYQISYCYSATLLKKMRERQHRHAPTKEFTAFAPYYTGNVDELAVIQPLQFSADSLYASLRSYTPNFLPINATGTEVRSISALTGGDVFYGSDATEARFDSIAGQYRIVHLATHGIADNRVGDYSFLAFHILPDSTENELLYVRDLYNLELNADMVVLSACETGLGELQRGEGIISLARAFAYAGAKSIVNTLWTVDDTSTGSLMIEFYSYLKQGKEKDEALRLAKLAFLKKNPRRALPFYWAGVIPVGDMRKLW